MCIYCRRLSRFGASSFILILFILLSTHCSLTNYCHNFSFIVATHTMGDRSYSYQLFHSLHVFSLLFILLYFFLSLSCPYCHSVIILSCHDTTAFAPPASVHPSLDNLSSTLLASLPFQRRSLLPSPRPSFFNSYRASLLIYFSLLLSGDIQLNPGPSTSNLISFATLNIRSASVVTSELDKPAVLHDFILDNSLDIVLLTETWLSNDVPSCVLNSLTPANFSLLHKPRLTGRGGGLAVLYRSYFKISEIPPPTASSFESLCFKLSLPCKTLNFLSVYRPPSGSVPSFLEEFSDLLAILCSQPAELVISGDFNLHVDDSSSSQTRSFLDLLESFGLKQHVNFPTHDSGHSLDLVITRSSSSSFLSNIHSHFPALSDHDAVIATISVPSNDRPSRVTKTIRSLRSINLTSLSQDIRSSTLYTSPPTILSDYLLEFNSVLSTLLDTHAPPKTITCSSRTPKSFITPEIRSAKAKRSHLETIYRKSKSSTDYANFKLQSKLVSKMISSSRRSFYRNLVANNTNDPKKLWTSLDKLLSRKSAPKLPFSIPSSNLPSAFLNFFNDKIVRLRSSISSTTFSPHISPASPPPPLNCFSPTTIEEVRKLILSSKNCTCSLDIFPTWLIKSCIDALLPPITTLLNLCLTEGSFPSSFKHAHVAPLLKKFNLPPDDLANYRPISNLSFLSKLLERLIANRLLLHLNSFPSVPKFQSAYRKFHSTETALLRIYNDLLLAIENKRVTALIFLDLSAAFDTVDHTILLSRLSLNFGLTSSALSLLTSYLSDRTQSVHVGSLSTSPSPVHTGVPQGSVLGPLLFTLYTTPLSYLLHDSGISYHMYADDTQLYLSFSSSDSCAILASLSNILDSVHQWLSSNFLSLNPNKTEYLLIGTAQQRSHITSDLLFSGCTIKPAAYVKNLGVTFDPELSLSKHISTVCQRSYHFIRLLRQVRSSLDHNSAVLLANSLVSSNLDYCNALYFDLPQSSLKRLQLVQNSLARAVLPSVKRRDHITSSLKKLHWLPINKRIQYKICLLTYKCLHNAAPPCLCELLKPYTPSRRLRSSDAHLLSIPVMKSRSGCRSFSSSSPSLWNSLPLNIKLSPTISSFRSSLKTHLYPP